jgi:hypothetical protein
MGHHHCGASRVHCVEQGCVVLLVMGRCVTRWIRPSPDLAVLNWKMLINICLLQKKVYTTFFFCRFLQENYVGVVALWVNLGAHFDGR